MIQKHKLNPFSQEEWVGYLFFFFLVGLVFFIFGAATLFADQDIVNEGQSNVYLPVQLTADCATGSGVKLRPGQGRVENLEAANEVDEYYFCGVEGDVTRIDIGRNSGDFNPDIEVYRPDDTLLCAGTETFDYLSLQCPLDADGTYRLLVRDTDMDGTGDYNLYMQRLNDPFGAVSLNFGETSAGTLIFPAERDTFTFSGESGDAVRIDMNRTGEDYFEPEVDLYRPGAELVECNTISEVSYTSLECALDEPGTYVILAGDAGLDHQGDYEIYLQRLTNPVGAAPLNVAEVVTGTLPFITHRNAYTFTGEMGDVVRVDVAQAEFNFHPGVDIYRPDGSNLCRSSGGYYLDDECALDASGTFVLLLGDDFRSRTGDYEMFMQRLTDPVGAVPLNYGEVVTGTMDLLVEVDTYTFDGNNGDVVRLDIVRTSGAFQPEVDIYRPDGSHLCAEFTSESFFSLECDLDMAGTYVMVLADREHVFTGAYELYLQRLNNPGATVPLSFGEVFTASLDLQTERDTYTFDGDSGDVVRIDMARSSGVFDPEIDVYRPNGSLLCDTSTTGNFQVLECDLDVTGQYTLLAGDLNYNETGEYGITIQRLIDPVGAVALTVGNVVTDSLDFVVERDTYTFDGANGAMVQIVMDRVSGNFEPQLDVYRPDGSLLCNSFTIGSTLTLDCTLDMTGIFVILAGDLNHNETGVYTLLLTNPGEEVPLFKLEH